MRKVFLLAALLTVLALPMTVFAQSELDPTVTPTWGSVTLLPPFLLDPYVATVGIGGTLDVSAANVGSGCLGFTDAAPAFVLNITGAAAGLTFALVSEQDTTIIVATPDGQFLCDDDSGGSLNPLVRVENAAAGAYTVWGGTYSQSSSLGYLVVSEAGGSLSDLVTTAFGSLIGFTSSGGGGGFSSAAGSELDANVPANYGSLDLASGFSPSPSTIDVVSGAAEGSQVDVSLLNPDGEFNCRGYATISPDFSINWTGGGDLLRIFFAAEGDATLIVRTPDGSFVCNDDFDGLDPLVDIASPAAGEYDVWVGTYFQGENSAGTLYITESSSATPSNPNS
jgi:hypothetical protein